VPARKKSAPAAPRFVTTTVEVEGRVETKIVELPAFEPAPWKEGAALSIAGRRVPRVDAFAKVTGRARYTVDLRRPGMLHAAILRAPIAHGRLVRLDLAPALAIPGVRFAISRADVPAIALTGGELFETEVRYAGQPIAALCADTPQLAARGLAAIVARYESAPHAVTIADALASGAPKVHAGGNLFEDPRIIERGDAVRALKRADVVITREYRTPTALHSALEPHASVAEWHEGRLTVWESTQGVFGVRDQLADAFGLAATDVRVIVEHMGGGFGAKSGASTNAYVAALLSRAVGRPVRCVNDRRAEQTDAGNRSATIQRVSIGAKRDGTLVAITLEAEACLGAGGWDGGPAHVFHDLYACPNVRTVERFVFTHTGAMASFRAPGSVEGAFALERAMDELARTLGLDPLALRLKNLSKKHPSSGKPFSANHLAECYRDGAKRFGWAKRARSSRGNIRRGSGMAAQIWGGGGGPPAYATVRLNNDGTAEVFTGTQDLGTGSRTVFAQIAAEALGAKLAHVRVVLGDTGTLPYTGPSWGSITVASVGPAVRMAAEDAKTHLLEAASGMLKVPAKRLEAKNGAVRVRGGKRGLSFAEIGKRLGHVMISGRGTRGPNPADTSLCTFGVQFAEVEVDVDTGVVRVLRIVASHDCGRIINPTLAESQLEGGIIQGLGYALFEERVLDRALGLPLNPNMHDYKVPTLADIPAIDARFVQYADTKANHIGARGVGEPPIIPTAPAIANAVADAIGCEVYELPLAPWRVLAALSRE
jgi:xanthine dehydrogenase YagR molybdenum-binding subunit